MSSCAGDVEALPEGTHQIGPGMMRIRPAAAAANGDAPEAHSAESPATENGLPNGDPKPHPGTTHDTSDLTIGAFPVRDIIGRFHTGGWY